MYEAIAATLNQAGEDPAVKAALITGAGDYYCSGNDLSNFTQIPAEGPKKLAADSRHVLRWAFSHDITLCHLLPISTVGELIRICKTFAN